MYTTTHGEMLQTGELTFIPRLSVQMGTLYRVESCDGFQAA